MDTRNKSNLDNDSETYPEQPDTEQDLYTSDLLSKLQADAEKRKFKNLLRSKLALALPILTLTWLAYHKFDPLTELNSLAATAAQSLNSIKLSLPPASAPAKELAPPTPEIAKPDLLAEIEQALAAQAFPKALGLISQLKETEPNNPAVDNLAAKYFYQKSVHLDQLSTQLNLINQAVLTNNDILASTQLLDDLLATDYEIGKLYLNVLANKIHLVILENFNKLPTNELIKLATSSEAIQPDPTMQAELTQYLQLSQSKLQSSPDEALWKAAQALSAKQLLLAKYLVELIPEDQRHTPEIILLEQKLAQVVTQQAQSLMHQLDQEKLNFWNHFNATVQELYRNGVSKILKASAPPSRLKDSNLLLKPVIPAAAITEVPTQANTAPLETSSQAPAEIPPQADPCQQLPNYFGPISKCQDHLPRKLLAPALVLLPASSKNAAFAISKPISVRDYNIYCLLTRKCEIFDPSQGKLPEYHASHQRQLRSEHAQQISACILKNNCTGVDQQSLDTPITGISAIQAQRYATWLSKVSHHRYQLPNDQQWLSALRYQQNNYPELATANLAFTANLPEWVYKNHRLMIRGPWAGKVELLSSNSNLEIKLSSQLEVGSLPPLGFRVARSF